MKQSLNIEISNSIKLKDFSRIQAEPIAMNPFETSNMNSQYKNPLLDTEISLILGDSFLDEQYSNIDSNHFQKRRRSTMKNKKLNLKIDLKNSVPYSEDKIVMEEKSNDFLFSKKLNYLKSSKSNMIEEETDTECFLQEKTRMDTYCNHDSEDDYIDPNFMSQDEIDLMISQKMRVLELYNVVVLKKGEDNTAFRYTQIII